jgi:hypothetical protein
MHARSFFRWTAAAVALWLFGVVFGVIAILNIWLATLARRGALRDFVTEGPSKEARVQLVSAAQNVEIAALCILGWYLMRRRTPTPLLGGAVAVAAGLFISLKRWVSWQSAGTDHWPWFEPLLVWPFLLYAIVYGYRESRGHDVPA